MEGGSRKILLNLKEMLNTPLQTSKLRVVHLKSEDNEADVVCCALGVRKDADGGLELLIYELHSIILHRRPLS